MADQQDALLAVSSKNLRLELSDCWTVDHYTDILESNASATDVDICVHESFSEIPIEQGVKFFASLGSMLPKLRRLELFPGVGGYNAVPVEALTAAVGLAASLESLYLYHIEISGEGGKFICFAEKLQRHPSLKEFCIIDCEIENEIGNERAFEPVLMALGTIPTLEVVALWASDDQALGDLSGVSLAALCRSQSVQRLMLLKFNLEDQDVASMFDTLTENMSMKRIYISCSLGKHGTTSLVKMLRSNSTMDKFKLDLDGADNQKSMLGIAQALESNTSLNYLKLCGGDMSTETQEAFLRMLQKNHSLETLLLPSGGDLAAQMDLYLKLNRSGFRHILKDTSGNRGQWVNALTNTNNDLDCLFFFLSMNPSLCVV